MNSVQLLEELLFTARLLTERYLADLTFEEICLAPGVGANPVVWQLGHLIVSEAEMIQRISGESSFSFPPSFCELHQKPNRGDLEESTYKTMHVSSDGWERWIQEIKSLYSKETYLNLLTVSRSRSIEVLQRLTLVELATPAPEQMARYAKTWASLFVMIGIHETQHAGQIAVLRRSLGKPIVV
jgi:hypothetical protein